MLDLHNCSCLSSRRFSIWFSLSIRLHPLLPIFSLFPSWLAVFFFSFFHSSNPPCHPMYTSIPVNMGTEKGLKVTLWQANQAFVFWHHSHPSGTLIWFQRPFAFHLWLSKVINLPRFPRRCWLTMESQPRKRKEQQRNWAMAFWFEQMISTGNIQYLKCTCLHVEIKCFWSAIFFNAWQICGLINTHTLHTCTFFPSDLPNPLNKFLILNNHAGRLLLCSKTAVNIFWPNATIFQFWVSLSNLS